MSGFRRLNIEIDADDEFHCDRSLIGNRIQDAIGYVSPTWDDMIAELLNDQTPYDELGSKDAATGG